MRGGILKQRLEGYEGSFSLEQEGVGGGGAVMLLMAQRASNVLGRTE